MRRNAKTAGMFAALGAGDAPVLWALVTGAPIFHSVGDVVAATGFWMIGSLFALPHLGLAAPLYFALRRRGWVNWGTAALSGFVIGAIPIPLLLSMLSWSQGMSISHTLDVAAMCGACGLCGLVGGLTFRAVLGKPT